MSMLTRSIRAGQPVAEEATGHKQEENLDNCIMYLMYPGLSTMMWANSAAAGEDARVSAPAGPDAISLSNRT
jgi:hypothetical protein